MVKMKKKNMQIEKYKVGENKNWFDHRLYNFLNPTWNGNTWNIEWEREDLQLD